MNGLDLFSGISGLSIALQEWVNPVAYCENDRYAQSVLLSRMLDGRIPRAPIWDNVTSLRGSMLPTIDIIYGGFPCQDISVAGHGKGLAGERSGLFYEIIRIATETRAPFLFLENVPAIRTRGLREVIRALTNLGYDCRWTCVSAAEVGAPHLRKRWFLLAHAQCERGRRDPLKKQTRSDETQLLGNKIPNPNCIGLWEQWQRREEGQTKTDDEPGHDGAKEYVAHSDSKQEKRIAITWQESDSWSTEPSVGRVVNGLPHRAHRIKCLGNAVVPEQAREAFKRLLGIPISHIG